MKKFVKNKLGITSSIFYDGVPDRNSIFIFDYHIPKYIRAVFYALMFVLQYYYLILLRIGKRAGRVEQRKYYFSICAIFKDESLTLKEWIEYHLIIGVDHFYLYNNNSTDNYMEILSPYIDEGVVDIVEWPLAPAGQLPAYENCFRNHSSETQWIAFIDLDEFICPYYETDIKKWIRKYKNFPSVFLYWKMFQSNGIIEYDSSKAMVEGYTGCWDLLYDTGKTVFNTDFDIYKLGPAELHEIPGCVSIFNRRFKIPPINEFKKFVNYKTNIIGWNNERKFSIQLNHYFSKSYQEYVTKKVKRGTGTNVGEIAKRARSMDSYFWHQHLGISQDYKIYRFLVELKIRLGLKN